MNVQDEPIFEATERQHGARLNARRWWLIRVVRQQGWTDAERARYAARYGARPEDGTTIVEQGGKL